MAGESAPGLAVFFLKEIKDCTINWAVKWVRTGKLTEYNRVPEESSFYSVGNIFCGGEHMRVLSEIVFFNIVIYHNKLPLVLFLLHPINFGNLYFCFHLS